MRENQNSPSRYTCRHAWSTLMSTPEQIASITQRPWAQVKL
jgi:hypothetical protein